MAFQPHPEGHGISGTGIDKDALYGKYEEGKKWNRERYERREKLSEDIARKAADLAPDLPDEEEMNINVRKGVEATELAKIIEAAKGKVAPPQVGGLSWLLWWLAGIALGTSAAGLILAGIATAYFVIDWNLPTIGGAADTEYDVRFYDKDGKLIDIQPLPRSDQ